MDFVGLYKYSGRNAEISQLRRRSEFLEQQKRSRNKAVDTSRDLSAILDLDEHEEDEMECENNVESAANRKIWKNKKFCCNFNLMKSEYLTELPEDLEENWYVKLCPKGVRVLLVAKAQKTRLYTEEGQYVLTTKTYFPGGGRTNSNGITILDCIYNRDAQVIFVLDCLYWNTMSMVDSEADLRFLWLKSKFSEDSTIGSHKKYKFYLIDFLPARINVIEDGMSRVEPVTSVHYYGVTFYHKEGIYSFGYTPLVAWLWTYMLPEKLSITVAQENMIHMPKNYINMDTYFEYLQKKEIRRKNRKSNKSDQLENGMECA